jgi:hypothetical protein
MANVHRFLRDIDGTLRTPSMLPSIFRHIAAVMACMLAMAATPVFAGLVTPNQPPVISASALRTEPFVRVGMGVSVADPDAGSRPLTITLTLLGAGARPPADVGVMTWNRSSFPMQTDTETLTLAELNASLQTLRFVSVLGFAGRAQVRIDVDDNAVIGPPGRDSVVMVIDVCGAGDITLQQCETNQAPRNVVPGTQRIVPGQVTTIPVSLDDPDVGKNGVRFTYPTSALRGWVDAPRERPRPCGSSLPRALESRRGRRHATVEGLCGWRRARRGRAIDRAVNGTKTGSGSLLARR